MISFSSSFTTVNTSKINGRHIHSSNTYCAPLEIIIGAFGNSFNLLIFTRKALRRNSCTQYFIAGAFNNALVVYFLFVIDVFSNGYGIVVSTHSSLTCKITCYLSYLIYNLSPYLLVLASFDRFCCSSTSARLRLWAQVKVARRIIAVMLIIFTAIFTPLLITYDLTVTNPPQCVSASQAFSTGWSFFELIFYALVPPFLMVLFSSLTLWNIRTQRRNIQPMGGTISSNGRGGKRPHRRSDNALLRMLTFQVFAYIICCTMLCVMVTMVSVVSQPTSLMITLLNISFLPFYLSYCTSFYIYTLSAQLYRQEILAIVNQTRQYIRNIIRAEHSH
jgi:hypothetical protein